MGQQQLLLLVLATVIVGLGTVAGIQAFDENQTQSTQDVLTERAVSIASEFKAVTSKPKSLGGFDIVDSKGNTISPKTAIDRASLENYVKPNGNKDQFRVAADGAGNGARCDVSTSSSGPKIDVICDAPNAERQVTVTFEPSASEEITTSYSSSAIDKPSDTL